MGGRSLRAGHFLPVAGALLVCILAGAGWAQSSNPKAAINWLRKCTSPEDYGQIECLGYVRALVEYDQLRGELGERRHICLGQDATVGDARNAVLKHLRDHPEDGKLPFAAAAHTALEVAFPCVAAPK
jgi:hypothetical protein